MIKDLLTGKSPQEQTVIKGQEIAKLEHRGIFVSPEYGLRIEILSLNEIVGGVEIFARAWKNGKQLGFGGDFTTEIERFRIINPPILVDDPNGDIVIEKIDSLGITHIRKLREDLIEAIRQSLADTIKTVGKENSPIVKGKIGNTTSTFYGADPQVGEGAVRYINAATWATAHDAASGSDAPSLTSVEYIYANKINANAWNIQRASFLWDTSSIPDTDTIDSATFSLCGDATATTDADSTDVRIVSSTVGAVLEQTDYDLFGTTSLATPINIASWSNSAYNVFTLNASGLAEISKTGTTFLGVRIGRDVDNSAPTGRDEVTAVFSENAGTTKDPKLVVVHTASSIPNKIYQLNQAVNRASTY